MAEKIISILCVDDNEAIGQAVSCKISIEADLHWLGQLENADQMVDEAQRLRPDVILLDLDMPGRHPLEAVKELAEKCPATRVIMLSGYVSDEYIDRAIDSGAWGYLAKSEGPDAIIAAVRSVHNGKVVFGPDVSRQYLRTRVGVPQH